MPVYNPRPLPYQQYIRSVTPGTFDVFDNPDFSVCWIDLLGVRSMPHTQIVSTVSTALDLATQATSTGPVDQNGNLIGTPNNAGQFAIIGDALVLTEKDQPTVRAAAKLSFFYRVNILSRLLNERGLIHRGVITTGEVKCFQHEGSSIITGAGVVRAAELEKKLQTAGLFYDETWTQFITCRQSQIDSQNFVVPFAQIPNWNSNQFAPNLHGVTFSQFEGWPHWGQCVASGLQTNNKVMNATSLIRELKNAYNLP